METIIVTRHSGAVEWLRKHHPEFGDVEVRSHVSAEEIEGKRVVGTLPIHLANKCAEYYHLEIEVPQDRRGTELNVEDMEEFGCKITRYHVFRAGKTELVTLYNDSVCFVSLEK